MTHKLSVALATHNEENNLADCLTSIASLADEIIIVDGMSTDKTVEIAKKFNAKIISAPNRSNFHINKRLAIDNAVGEWILQLDADEVVSSDLLVEIKRIISSPTSVNGYWIPRRNYFLGKFLQKGGVYPDFTLRLYRRGKGTLPAISVHEQAKIIGETAYLSSPLLHYSNRSFREYIEKRFNRYTDLMANDLKGGLVENVFIRPLFDSNQGFLSIYVRHLGFIDGFPGFVWALFSCLHFPIAFFKRNEKNIGY